MDEGTLLASGVLHHYNKGVLLEKNNVMEEQASTKESGGSDDIRKMETHVAPSLQTDRMGTATTRRAGKEE